MLEELTVVNFCMINGQKKFYKNNVVLCANVNIIQNWKQTDLFKLYFKCIKHFLYFLKVKQKQQNIPAESQMLSQLIRKKQEEESSLVKTQPLVSMAENVEQELPELMEDLKLATDKYEKSKILQEVKEKQLNEAREKFKKIMESQVFF